MPSYKANVQHLRSFNPGEHPRNLDPGQIGFNHSLEGTYVYLGTGSDERVDSDGTDLSQGLVGLYTGKGWVRNLLGSSPSLSPSSWGSLTGFIEDQADLQSELSGKMSASTYDTNGNGVVDTAATVQKINTFGSIYLESPSVRVIPLFTSPSTTIIQGVRGVKLSSGTATLSIQIDGVSVGGLESVSVTTVPQNIDSTGLNIANPGGRVTVNLTVVDLAENLEFTLAAEVS